MPAVTPVNAEEWDYLDIDVLPETRPLLKGMYDLPALPL